MSRPRTAPFGVVAVAECFLLRTRPANASVIRAAVDLDDVSAVSAERNLPKSAV